MKNFGKIMLVIVLVLAVFIALVGLEVGSYKLGGFLGKEKAKMVGEINTEVVSQEDDVFKNSTQYIDNTIRQLSKTRKEMLKNEDYPALQQALAEEIQELYAEFDASKIKNDSLRYWFLDVLEGVY